MIYLDNFGHLFSDESLQELYDFAVKKLKFKPNWNHYSRHFPHFDILTEGKKWQAIRNGAIYLENATKSYKKIKFNWFFFHLYYEQTRRIYEIINHTHHDIIIFDIL